MDDKLKELQENLAKDLVYLEIDETISKDDLDEVTFVYSQVYDIIMHIMKKW